MKISFSPPDIGQDEINEVVDTLKSGWITTGPKTKEFEKQISIYCGSDKTVCLNSATAALELTLRILGVGDGDEVITSAYTYTASASVIEHVGAKIVLVDTEKDSLEMNYELLEKAITSRTKVIIPVDIAGCICNYEKIFRVVEAKSKVFCPSNDIQKIFNRIIVVTDGAHAFGATKNGIKCGCFADFTTFSFHAVKNLTTGEGGAVTWINKEGLDSEELYKQYQLMSLHGQNKDALAKTRLGAWEYDIVAPYFKCNMTDIMASIGLAQLRRYDSILARRREIVEKYTEAFKCSKIICLDHSNSSCHLYITRIKGIDEVIRNQIIIKMAEKGIACNVHYKPLAMFTAYKKLGFNMDNYPNAFDFYKNEITLPLHTCLTDEEVEYVIKSYLEIIKCY